MSFPYKYKLDPVETPGYCHVGNLTEESADVASRILMANRTAYNVFTTHFDKMGAYLHNHIAYHTLALWALGASPETMTFHMKNNENYQILPRKFIDEPMVEEMSTDAGIRKYRGSLDNFLDFTTFFEREIDRLGYEAVLQKYMFGGSEIADDILGRMFHGYIHSFMYVGMGLEFKQLPLIAEGLAQALSHNDMYYNDFLSHVEKKAHLGEESILSLAECLDECRKDPVISTCSNVEVHYQVKEGHWKVEVEPLRDYICCGPAFNNMARVAARYRVNPDDLDRANAEIINTGVWMAASAQLPPYKCRYDFFLIHCTNAAMWQTAFTNEPSLTNLQKARLIEMAGRVMMMMYTAMGCPEPRLDWLLSQTPKEPGSDWPRVFERVCQHKDDGHMAKLIRVIRHAQDVSLPYEDRPEFRMKQHMFLPAAQAAVDSGTDRPMHGVFHFDFVRGAAYPEAWERSNYPKRDEKEVVVVTAA